MDIIYITEKPQNLSQQQKHYFQKLLLLQGQIDNPSLDKINSCPFLCLAYDKEIPIGIGAIKQVYKMPFDKAEVVEFKDIYEIELGYLYVLDKKKYRGKGIAKSICTRLLNKVKLKNVFATTEESDENAMKWILQKFGFKKTGKTYQGGKTKKILVCICWHLHHNNNLQLTSALPQLLSF